MATENGSNPVHTFLMICSGVLFICTVCMIFGFVIYKPVDWVKKEAEPIPDGHWHVVHEYMIKDAAGNYYKNEFGKPHWPLERHAQVECNYLNRQWKEKHEN